MTRDDQQLEQPTDVAERVPRNFASASRSDIGFSGWPFGRIASARYVVPVFVVSFNDSRCV